MPIILTAVAAALFYLANVRIRAAFSLLLGEQNQLRVGVGLFSAGLIYERQFLLPGLPSADDGENPLGQQRLPGAGGKRESRAPVALKIRAATRAGRYLLNHARLRDARFSLRLGTGDARRTALICGALEILIRALNASGRMRFSARVRPDFGKRALRVSAGGMIYVPLGHIMIAALKGAAQLATWRIQHGQASD